MQLGFVSAILPELTFERVVQVAAETGYDCVEVMCWPVGKANRRYAGVTHLEVVDFGPDQAARARAIARDAGVEISGLGYYPNPLSPDAEESRVAIEHLRKTIEAAVLIEVPRVNTFVGRDWTRSVDDNWPRFLEVWRPLVRFAAERGVRIGIENCPMLFTADEWPGGKNLAGSPAIWRRMFQDIPEENFGLNYDPSHLVWQHMDYLAPIREFAARFSHVHAKDAKIEKHALDQVGILAPPNAFHTPKLPGLGDVDWGKFCSTLTDVGYRGPVCVEVEDRAYEKTLEDRRRALVQSARYLRNFIT